MATRALEVAQLGELTRSSDLAPPIPERRGPEEAEAFEVTPTREGEVVDPRGAEGAGAISVTSERASASEHQRPTAASDDEEDDVAPVFGDHKGDERRRLLARLLAEPDAEQEARVARGYEFAMKGVYELPNDKPMSMSVLRRAARAAERAAISGDDGRNPRPSAADPKALWAAAPRRLWDGAAAGPFVPPPRAEREREHPRVDASVIAGWHEADGCADCRAGALCYITALRRHAEAFELPFRDGCQPRALLDPSRSSFRAAVSESEADREMRKITAEYLDAGVFEEVENADDLSQCACIAPVHLAVKQGLRVDPAEQAAIDAYDVPEMRRLAGQRGGAIFNAAEAAAGGKAWTRDAVEAAMEGHRSGPKKYRFVVGLHLTVNELVEDWDFKYVDFESEWAESNHPWLTSDLVSKKDFVKGFYSVEIAEKDRRFFCFRDPRDPTGKRILRYKRLPMGFKLAPALYSALTSEVARHLNASAYGLAGALYRFYVDDMGLKAPAGLAPAAHQFAHDELAPARMPWGEGKGKNDPPASSNTITGREFNSDVGGAPMVRVAAKALFTALVDLELVLRATATEAARLPVEWLRSMAGRLSWVAQSTYAARLHMGSIWYLTTHAPSPRGMVRVGRHSGAASDARWFLDAAVAGRLRGWRSVRPDQLQPGTVPIVEADASGDVGCGALCDGRVLWHVWVAQERNWSIQAKELRPLLEAARAFGDEWCGKVVVFRTDNLGNAYGINRGKAMPGAAANMMAELYELADEKGFEFLAVWLPRRYNASADAISKAATLEAARAAAREHGLAESNVVAF